MELSQHLTEQERAQLYALAAKCRAEDRRCQCGKPKAPQHITCLSCSRHVGPYVLVESPSGNYVEAGGLESAESLVSRTLLNRNATAPVQV